jgi:hypothetical protein
MGEYESKVNQKFARKPAANHPWRKPMVKREITEFAKEKSTNAIVNSWKVGGGKPQK